MGLYEWKITILRQIRKTTSKCIPNNGQTARNLTKHKYKVILFMHKHYPALAIDSLNTVSAILSIDSPLPDNL